MTSFKFNEFVIFFIIQDAVFSLQYVLMGNKKTSHIAQMFAIYLVFHRLKCIFCKDAPVFIISVLLISLKKLFEEALFSIYRLASHLSQHYLLLCETHIWRHAPIKNAFFEFCLAAQFMAKKFCTICVFLLIWCTIQSA